jgi:cytochrome c oxidase subunit 3
MRLHFHSLLISYGALRFSSPSWPAPDLVFQSVPLTSLTHGYPLVFVGIMTFILIASSVTMVLAVEAGHRNSKKEVIGGC